MKKRIHNKDSIANLWKRTRKENIFSNYLSDLLRTQVLGGKAIRIFLHIGIKWESLKGMLNEWNISGYAASLD